MRTKTARGFAFVGGAAIAIMVVFAGMAPGWVADAAPVQAPDMTTAATHTVTTGVRAIPTPVARPSITGPAPLPVEQQGLPG